ncbi:hypothetical protein DPX39_080012800 [Trypanosoma brucei equiperdum]|uniref:Uncharacterized protein n=1 Tax=Trypanosoma brucei equiperdum TaxID=630700 RepID=A0A3L6L4T7_9TRYP|nr:hypothetical protein DPX39_080012800 [Trypanosoma brucei equiperdum]
MLWQAKRTQGRCSSLLNTGFVVIISTTVPAVVV